MSVPSPSPRHFYSLDLLRGLGAFVVVLWHWQHFFYVGTTRGVFHPERQPFYFVLRPFYSYGFLAVDLFFSLSGFIFFWLYAERITHRQVTAREFFLIEVLLYAVFFVGCTLQWTRGWQLVLIVFLSCLMPRVGLDYLARGMFSFFVGGLTYRFFQHFNNRGVSRALLVWLTAAIAALWYLIPVNFAGNLLYQRYRASPGREIFFVHHKDVLGAVLITVTENSLAAFLFPLTILTLALWEASRGSLGRRVKLLGDISYSVYLIHFPLQLVFVGCAISFAVPRSAFYSPLMFFAFFAVLVPLALGSYNFLERPAQRKLRAWLS